MSTSKKTAETIAKQHGVSEKTVRNAEKVLDAVDALEKVESGIKQKMLNSAILRRPHASTCKRYIAF